MESKGLVASLRGVGGSAPSPTPAPLPRGPSPGLLDKFPGALNLIAMAVAVRATFP
jgi:hypothetical protein